MTDNEKLIKELRTWAALIGSEPRGARDVFNRAADALEASEKAHAPTDDEQGTYELAVDMLEDLLVAVGVFPAEHGISIRKTAGALVYKLRRPVPPEPKCEHGTSLTELCEHVERLVNAEPQTEPTDAQVLAALNARERSIHGSSGGRRYVPAPDLSYWDALTIEHMRAALRAAAEVKAEPTDADLAIEPAAESLYNEFTYNLIAGWDDIEEAERERYRDAARAALRAASSEQGKNR